MEVPLGAEGAQLTGLACADQWLRNAHGWAQIGHPLKPDAGDIARMRAAIAPCAGRGLVLGVTPGLIEALPGSIAVDLSVAMIAAMPAAAGDRRVICGDWRALPFGDNALDFAVGDGSLSALCYPRDYQILFGELGRVLRSGGRAVFRIFSMPDPAPSPHQVIAEALRGHIASFHAFKFRFAQAMAAQGGSPNIALGAVHRAFAAAMPDRQALARGTGWAPQTVGTIDAYQGSSATYSFPTVTALHGLVARCGWYPVFAEAADYAHGDTYRVHGFQHRAAIRPVRSDDTDRSARLPPPGG